jgi:hypothetical protein
MVNFKITDLSYRLNDERGKTDRTNPENKFMKIEKGGGKEGIEVGSRR